MADTVIVEFEVLLYVHRNRRFIRDGSPGLPPRLFTQLLSSDIFLFLFIALTQHISLLSRFIY